MLAVIAAAAVAVIKMITWKANIIVSSEKNYAPCPHCAANNVTYRNICWRCGNALPYTVGLDGKLRPNPEALGRPVSRAEIDRLLDQAETFDLEQERRQVEEAAAEQTRGANAMQRSRVWLWLRHRIERPSGA